jgi:polyketide biosynthesis acyl carrier protein
MDRHGVFAVIKEVILEIIPELEADQIRLEGGLKDLGANSMDRVEIVTYSMERLGIKVPRESLAATKDLPGLVELFFARVNGD